MLPGVIWRSGKSLNADPTAKAAPLRISGMQV